MDAAASVRPVAVADEFPDRLAWRASGCEVPEKRWNQLNSDFRWRFGEQACDQLFHIKTFGFRAVAQ